MTTLFLVCGMAGSGKTTLAKQLEVSRNAVRFSPDEWIKAIIKDETNKTELDRLRNPIEALQWSSAQKVLRRGVSVILENGFWSKEERIAYRNEAKQIGVRVELHYLNVPSDELWRRIQRRNSERSTTSFTITRQELEQWLACFEPPDSSESTLYDSFREHRS